jgi:hypothetical protein
MASCERERANGPSFCIGIPVRTLRADARTSGAFALARAATALASPPAALACTPRPRDIAAQAHEDTGGVPRRETCEGEVGDVRHPARRSAGGGCVECRIHRDGGVTQGQFGRGPTRARSHSPGRTCWSACCRTRCCRPSGRWWRCATHSACASRERGFRSRLRRASSTPSREFTGRTVYSFASATDPRPGVVIEIFVFEPDASRDGDGSLRVR